MIGAIRTPAQQLVTVFGGSGFLGRHVVRALAQRGYRVLVATRRPELAGHLQPLGRVGQIHAIQANLRYPESVRHAVAKADHVVNLVGILQESGRQTFSTLQAEGPRLIAESAVRDARVVHVSAIGADPHSESLYARTKAEGEAGFLAARPDARGVPPLGPVRAGRRLLHPLRGARARCSPSSRSRAPTRASSRSTRATSRRPSPGRSTANVPGGRIYELGGPERRTLRALVDYVLEQTERRRLVVPLPWSVARLQGSVHRHPRPPHPRPHAGRFRDHPGPGHPARARQRGVGGGRARGPDARGPRHRADGLRGDRAVLPDALPQDGASSTSRATRPRSDERPISRRPDSTGPGSGLEPGGRASGPAARQGSAR